MHCAMPENYLLLINPSLFVISWEIFFPVWLEEVYG